MDTSEYILAKNKYGKYAVPKSSSHRPAAQTIINGGVWEPNTIQFMMENCGNGAIVTAGTYFGDFLPALCSLGNNIYAFEPCQENWAHALETIHLNFKNTEHIRLVNAGLGDNQQSAQLNTVDSNGNKMGGISRLIYNIENTKKEQLTVNIVKIDDYVKPNDPVSIIQLDVEGFEEKSLEGGLKLIHKYKPIIIIECWSPTVLNTSFFNDVLYPIGYKNVGNLHDNAVLRCCT